MRGRLQGVEPRAGVRHRLQRRVLRQHPRPRRRRLAPRGVHRADGSRRGHALAHVLGRVQALHGGPLPGRLPHRRAVPDRVRHRRRAGGRLQRLRLLRAGVPVRGDRPAQGRRAGVEVHAVLRPPEGRQGAGLRAGLPHELDPVRRARRAARARRRARREAPRRRPVFGAALRGRSRRRRRRLRRLLPPARRARDLRAAPRPEGHDTRSAADLRLRGGRRGRARRRPGGRRVRGPAMTRSAAPAQTDHSSPGFTRRLGADRPGVKEPVWKPEIPFYFYTGGVGGASAGLALLSELRGNDVLARRAWAAALAGAGGRPALLIADLGVPSRFLNMLRMFKVTSPMSVGSWLLSAFGTTAGIAAVDVLARGRVPVLRPVARVAAPAAALLGLPLASYTGALISDTAVPVW